MISHQSPHEHQAPQTAVPVEISSLGKAKIDKSN